MIKVTYTMTVAEANAGAMAAALADLGKVIEGLPGCNGTRALQSTDQAGLFLFEENWPSAEVYAEAAPLLPKEAFAVIKPLLTAPPARSMWQGD